MDLDVITKPGSIPDTGYDLGKFDLLLAHVLSEPDIKLGGPSLSLVTQWVHHLLV